MASSSGSEDMNKTPPCEAFKRSCSDCHTTSTPLWRGGPAGPRTLCNACGIRERKKRRAFLGIEKETQENCKKKKRSNGNSKPNKVGRPLKVRLMVMGTKMSFQRSSSSPKGYENQMNKLGEEEQAALLLMALSCGSMYS